MITVRVDQVHIDEGREGNCGYCPIALALKGMYPGVTPVRVTSDWAYVAGQSYRLPREARLFILAYDARLPVHAFSFELEAPAP